MAVTGLLAFLLQGAEGASAPSSAIRPMADRRVSTVGYVPDQIRHAYGFDQITATGRGRTVGIVVAYGSPTLEQDLPMFSRRFGLPPIGLTVAYPQGKPERADRAWGLETSLDVEWVHALAPDAAILLVVARTGTRKDLLEAVDAATGQGAQVVLMSWGRPEFSDEESYDVHFRHAGTAYVAPTGDTGPGVFWPAVSPYVLAVGGTTLPLDDVGNRTGPEAPWPNTGGGISQFVAQPAYQVHHTGETTGRRAVPDVSFLADRSTGVAVYNTTYSDDGWVTLGGTSFAATAWAAVLALRTGEPPAIPDALYTAPARGLRYIPTTQGAALHYNTATGLGVPDVRVLLGAPRNWAAAVRSYPFFQLTTSR